MNRKKIFDEKSGLLYIIVIIITLVISLIISVQYYVTLKLLITILAVYEYNVFSTKNELFAKKYFFVIAILFNPIIPYFLPFQLLWLFIDVSLSLILIYSLNRSIKNTNYEILESGISEFNNDLDSLIREYVNDNDKREILDKHKKVYDILKAKKKHQLSDEDLEFILLYENFDQFIDSINSQYLKTKNIFQEFHDDLQNLSGKYIANSDKLSFLDKHRHLIDVNKETYKMHEGLLSEFIDFCNSGIDDYIKSENEKYISEECRRNSKLFDHIDGKSLDQQQRTAVVTDEDNLLIVAGAGSGKTLTIAAKVNYLVNIKKIDPREILLISFQNKSAQEMTDRIKKIGIDISALTFHKLGLDIVTLSHKAKPSVFDDIRSSEIFKSFLEENTRRNTSILTKFIEFFSLYINNPEDPSEHETLGSYYQAIASRDFETLKSQYESYKFNLKQKKKVTLSGEMVRSAEELTIANFLFIRGINYEYEAPYKYDTADQYHRQYKPDFYLPDYDIYIEHFGVSKDERVPWLTPVEEKKYLDSMTWKRQLHKEKNTKLIETYSYQNAQGDLLSELENKLASLNVRMEEIDAVEIYNAVIENSESPEVKSLTNLFMCFLNLFKTNNYDIDKFDRFIDLAKREQNIFRRNRKTLFLEVIKNFYSFYENHLMQRNEIDFNDMINNAVEIIKSRKIKLKYKYIIIDEYQDIATNRYRLVKEIRDMTNSKVFCVGDDWQSIFRFTGSNVDYFINFEKYFGFSKTMKIEKVYRNSQELIDIAGKFVMENPRQIQKKLLSNKHFSNPLRLIGYECKEDFTQSLKNVIEDIVNQFGTESAILILGRNNFDIKDIDTEHHRDIYIAWGKGGDTSNVKVVYSKYKDLKIRFLTVHKAKGLEEDNVILINAKNSRNGFPNQIIDDPILDYVLPSVDGEYKRYDFDEERRLFYVGITRSKNTTYILSPNNRQSIFITELEEKFNLKVEYDDDHSMLNAPKCKRCQTGHLVIREKDGRGFLACSNYPHCNKTYKDIGILKDAIECRSCGGYMTLRSGRFGKFYGCTNFPLCKNSFQITKQ